MAETHHDTIARALTDGSATRRVLAQGLAGLALAMGLSRIAAEEAAAKKRRKRKKKRKGRNRGGGDAPPGGQNPPPGGNNPPPPPPPPGCNGTICDGECVDLDSDPNNCGFCGGVCPDGATCVNGDCVLAIGSQGSGDGQLDRPTGIATNGIVLVTDTGNERVVDLFGGTFNDDQFEVPAGIAVNAETGEIYVADAGTSTIHHISSAGETLEIFGSFGSGVDQFQAPFGVAVDQQTGQVFVADSDNNRIQRLSSTLFPVGRFGRAGSGPGEFQSPLGVAIDANRNVIVADSGNNRIQILDQDGRPIREFGRQGSGPGEFDSPVAVAVSGGTIFVVDRGNHRVQQFTSTGQLLRVFGGFGSGLGQFNTPSGIAITDDDVILVVDSLNHRIQAFIPPELEARARALTARSRWRKRKNR